MNKQIDSQIEDLPFQTLPCSEKSAKDIVFSEPWEARAFGLAVELNQSGLFEWKDWVTRFNEQINIAQSKGDPDLGDTYYNHWLLTLEKILIDMELLDQSEISSKEKAILKEIEEIQHRHSHTHN